MDKSEKEWKKELNEKEYEVLRNRGTEKPFSGEYLKEERDGVYVCKACGNELFDSSVKFESGSGWPSFYKVINEGNIKIKEDKRGGMVRNEVECGKCGSHLGHVFGDGPEPTGKRYCINSVSLDLEEDS